MSGKLGSGTSVANTNAIILNNTGGVRTININVVNTDANDVRINLAIASSSSLASISTEWIEYNTLLSGASSTNGGGVLERTGIVISPGEQVVIYAPTSLCLVRVHGFDEV